MTCHCASAVSLLCVMIRQLESTDVESYAHLRQQALLGSPLAFGSSPADDVAKTVEDSRELLGRQDQGAVFGSFSDEQLVGTVGINRPTKPKSAHKAHIWGMYVAAENRRQGRGAVLVNAAIAHARKLDGVDWVEIGVTSAAPHARRLYEKMGFVLWGTEPEVLRYEGEATDLHFLTLRLDRA